MPEDRSIANPNESKSKRQLLREIAELQDRLAVAERRLSSNASRSNLVGQAIQEGEDRFALALQVTQEGLWDWNLETDAVYYSPCWKQMLGYSEEEIEPHMRAWERLLHPDDRARAIALKEALLRGEADYTHEIRLRHKDGRYRTILSHAIPLRRGADGPIVRLVGTHLDITERKRAEEALWVSEEKYRSLFVGMDEGFCIIEVLFTSDNRPVDYRFLEVNPAFERQTGMPEVVGKRVSELVPDPEKNGLETYGKVAVTGKAVRFEQEAKDLARYLDVYAFRFGGAESRKVAVIFTDISERKRMDEERIDARNALKAERDILQAVMNGARQSHLAYLDREFTFVRVNEAYARACGYAPEEMIGKNHFVLYPHPENETIFTRVRDTGEPVEVHDKPFEYPDQPERGTTYWDWTLVPVKDASGKVEGLVLSLIETTVRKLAEEALRALTQTLEKRVADRTAELQTLHQALVRQSRILDAFFQHSLTPLAILDREFTFIRVNEAYAKAGGRQVEDFPGHNHFDFYAEEARGIFEEVLRSKMSYRGFARPFTFPDHPEWGVSYWNWSFTPLLDAQGEVEALVLALEDVTAPKQAEEALQTLNAALDQRARQLQALALQLTEAEEQVRRRIADLLHDDLQQLLSASRFHLSALRPILQTNQTAGLILQQVDQLLEQSIQKSRNLSHELSPAILRHSGLVAAVEWLARRMEEHHGLRVEVDAKGWKRQKNEALRVFLFRAVQELLLNVVKHSGSNGARVHITSSAVQVELVVTDSGEGFDPKSLEKPKKPGDGFGLFSLDERVRSIGGRLKVDSSPGRGSRVALFVPLEGLNEERRSGALHPVAHLQPFSADPRPGVEKHVRYRVLVVDDHPMMRQGLVSVLESQPGIQVIGKASSGREAVQLARGLSPDVVVMDVVMPGMDGIEATRLIKRELPQVRVIGLSMLDDEQVAGRLKEAGAESYINKGNASEALVEAIRGKNADKEGL